MEYPPNVLQVIFLGLFLLKTVGNLQSVYFAARDRSLHKPARSDPPMIGWDVAIVFGLTLSTAFSGTGHLLFLTTLGVLVVSVVVSMVTVGVARSLRRDVARRDPTAAPG